MTMHRRTFLRLMAGASAAFPAWSRAAFAETYPSRPVHVIVGLAPGGGVDIVARLMGQWLSSHFGQSFVIENRPGAGTNIATEVVVNAPADGYTLLQASTPNAINASLYRHMPFDYMRDIAPVGGIVRSALVMVVSPSFPAKTVPEFITYAKANPGKISMGSAGIGTPLHVAGELFAMMTGISMVHIPYKGSTPALTDLLGGQVQVVFSDTGGSNGFIAAGKLHALAVTAATRLPTLPDVPSISEFVPGYEASIWQGMGAPKGTPPAIIDALNREVDAGLADPALAARLTASGYTTFAGTPADFADFVAAETLKWAKVIKFAKIAPA